MKKLIAALCLVSVPAMAETPCNYDHNVETQFTKSIDKSEVIDRKVFPYVDDTRKCVMSMMILSMVKSILVLVTLYLDQTCLRMLHALKQNREQS